MLEICGNGKETSENGSDSSSDDIEYVEETPENTILSQQTSINLVPFIGQRFVSQDAAYEFYCSFAKQCGFSIRRHRTRGKDGVGKGITRRDFTCHRGGYPQLKPVEDGKSLRNRKSSRCGCQAFMRIVKRSDFNVPDWHVTGFSNIHNHELLESTEVQLLPGYCTISADDKTRICMFAKAGMSVRQMLRLMELERGVKLGCLPFTEIDVRNLLQSLRKVDHDDEPIDLLKMCKEKKDQDPNFKYNFKVDANNRLEHIAWSYASSMKLYEAFGDVMAFETTNRLDVYDMFLGIWIGVDNHGMYCFFGCVLLRDENLQSFSWALKTFLNFMNGKAPLSFFTSQNMWLKEAVATEMPKTKHAFGIWHILSKFSDWFSLLLGSRYNNWKAEFHRLYNLHSVEEFEVGWREMVDTYGLHRNKHIRSLYALRSFWALCFLRPYFFAGGTSTFQLESVNAYMQQVLSAESALNNFVEQIASFVDVNYQAEARQKLQQKIQKISFKTGSPIESHAASLLTPFAFTKLQEELVLAPQYASMIDENYFIVRYHTEMEGGWKVIWIPQDEFISCSCHHYDFTGILCRHVLRVLSANNCFQIPDQYLPMRWREVSSSLSKANPSSVPVDHTGKVQLLQSMISTLINESIETGERLEFACEQISFVLAGIKDLPGTSDSSDDIAHNSPSVSFFLPEAEDSEGLTQSFTRNHHDSVNQAKLKEKRTLDGFEIYRKRRRCPVSCCSQFDHDANSGPMMGGDDLNEEGLGFL